VRLALALSIAASPALLVAHPAQAATFLRLSLNSHPVTVQTTTGQALKLSVAAFKDIAKSDTGQVSVNVTLSTGQPVAFGETHVWSFQTSRRAFTFHQDSGRGTLATAKALGAFGSLDLSFDKTKRDVENCAVRGTMTTFTGTLRGAVHFHSSSAWGRFDKRRLNFTTPNTIAIDHDCDQGEQGDEDDQGGCEESITWSGPTAIVPDGVATEYGSVIFTGEREDRPRITGVRNVHLSAPNGAARADYLVSEAEPPQASGDTLAIATKPHRTIGGSAMISGGQEAPPVTGKCTDASSGQQVDEQTAGFFGATWASPANDPLTFDFAAAPNFTASTGGSASWNHTTFGQPGP
jgi:hypothetical protein